MVDVIVLGAGIVGVSTALHLRNRGAEVTLLDHTGPEDAASFGNAGVLQSEAVEPYGIPQNLTTLSRMFLGRDNGLTYDLAGLWSNFPALAEYWRHSRPARHRTISQTYSALISQALTDHGALIAQSNADHLIRRGGYLSIHRNQAQLDIAAGDAARLAQSFNVPSVTLSPQETTNLEPGLTLESGGAIHWTGPWTVTDPGELVRAYEAAFITAGGQRGVGDARTLVRSASGSWQVQSDDGPVSAGHVVLATGAATPALAQAFGHRFQLVHKRGYHRHFDAPRTLSRPVVDELNGFVMSPMQGGLRIATGAALVRQPDSKPSQLIRSTTLAETLLRQKLTPTSEIWSGVRPCMPDMLPVVGQSRSHPGFWFHFGHGHQGLTLGPTTARMLSEQVMGRNSRTEVETAISPDRFAP